MKFNRMGRILVCLVLICALVVNISPIKAEAVVAELTAAQLLKWGVVAMVTLMTCGVFFQIQNEHELQDLGRTYYNHAHAAASAAERLDDLEAMNDVIGEAVDNKIIPFGGSGALPDSFWKSLLSIATISLLDVFLKNADGYFEAHYPSSGTLSVGESVNHHGITYTVTNCSAPVFYFTQCYSTGCQTVFCSSESFSWSRDVSLGTTLKSPYSLTYDGVYMYMANETVGLDGYGTSCYPCDEQWTVYALRARAAGIVGTGSPTYNISPSLIEGDLQEDYELVGDTHTLQIPDIDFSSMSSEQDIIDTANKVISGEMTYEELLNQLSSGVAPSVVPNTESEPGTSTDPEIKTDYTTWFQKIFDGITELPQKIANAFKTLLQELFVPAPEFIPNKVEALKAEYTFLDPMLSTGEDLKLFFQNIGSQPPIIWIDLGAGSGWYPMGGKVKFVDLTWYAQYKPTVDPIVGGFIWLWLAWRLFKGIPGLLSGDSGTVGTPTVAPDITFIQPRLPAGRSRRKKDGE